MMVEIENLRKVYEDTGSSKEILNNFYLTIDDNEFLCILGPSGCGKTTLLRCLAGFETYEGSIRINGKIKKKPETDCIMVFQDYNQLFPWKTVEQNIQYPLKIQGIRDKERRKSISSEVLKIVKLTKFANYYPYQLSGGMKQRAAIAKTLALKPKIILMDEPFAALDAMTRNTLQVELQEICQRQNCTVVFITHNIQEAIVLGTRILVMSKEGHIMRDEKNSLQKPITPASEGYGDMWKRMWEALYESL